MNSNENMILESKNITKRFKGITAVDKVSLGLKKNETVGLIGANGAGKTTFFNLLTGNYIPEEGKILYKNKDITKNKPEKRVDMGIMRTFQLASTFDNLRVIDNMRLAYFKAFCPSSMFNILSSTLEGVQSKKIQKYLDTFKLEHLADRFTKSISLGEKRILEIAMALITDPEVLLLDEPFAGLSEAEIKDVLNILKEHVNKKSILIVEHKISQIKDLVERIAVMVEGEIIASGEPEEVLNAPRVRNEYWNIKE